ncbi:MAG: hypothetical protein EA443_03755 [Nitrosopumilus sp.]|nr:MAG: hypothetical protein EA443_03755 [Nitrosopumilus sp.]
MFFKTMIMYCNKLDQSCNIFISKFYVLIGMSEMVWKCFRCNLSFKDESLADMHKQISKHSVTKVKTIVA